MPFFNQKEYYKNEDLSLSNLVHFYIILDTFIRFYTLLYDLEHPYDPHTNVSINVPTSIRACLFNDLLDYKYLRKKLIENDVEICEF